MYFIREQQPNKERERRTPKPLVEPHQKPTEPRQRAKRTRKRPEFTRLPTGGVVPD